MSFTLDLKVRLLCFLLMALAIHSLFTEGCHLHCRWFRSCILSPSPPLSPFLSFSALQLLNNLYGMFKGLPQSSFRSQIHLFLAPTALSPSLRQVHQMPLCYPHGNQGNPWPRAWPSSASLLSGRAKLAIFPTPAAWRTATQMQTVDEESSGSKLSFIYINQVLHCKTLFCSAVLHILRNIYFSRLHVFVSKPSFSMIFLVGRAAF